MPKPSGFTALVSTRIQDMGGNLLTGSLEIQATDAFNHPVDAVVAGGAGGPMVAVTEFTFTNGAIAANTWIPDSALTTNPHTSYRFTFRDGNGAILRTWKGVQPTGDSFNLDTYQPTLVAPQGIQVPGLPGASAYALAVAGGFSGTLPEWIASLIGPPGAGTADGVPITPTSVEVGAAIDQALDADNPANLVWAAGTNDGKAIIGIEKVTLRFKAFAGASIKGGASEIDGATITNSTLGAGNTIEEISVGAAVERAIADSGDVNQLGIIDPVTDASGRTIEGFWPGTLEKFLPAGIRGWSQSTAAYDSDGIGYYSVPVPSITNDLSYAQIFRLDEMGHAWQLTFGNANNLAVSLSAGEKLLVFMSDRGGSGFKPFQMNRGGLAQLPCGTLTDVDVWHAAGIGQSNMTALGGGLLSTAQPYSNLMLNGGVRSGSDNNFPVASSQVASLVPLVETNPNTNTAGVNGDGGDGETQMSGTVNQLTARALAAGIPLRQVATVNGWSGTSVANRIIGTVVYSNGLAQVTAAHALLAAQGLRHAVKYLVGTDGESNEFDLTYGTQVYAELQSYWTSYKAITGQPDNFPLCLNQPACWTHFNNSAVGTSAYQQLALMRQYLGQVLISCAKYQFATVDGNHLSAASQRWLGEYNARALYWQLVLGKVWRPVYPRAISRTGKYVYVRFWLGAGKQLVNDTAGLVTPPTSNPSGLDGFEYFDASGSTPAITAVDVLGADTVRITLASIPANGGNYIAYGYTGTPGAYAGPTTGARGCLRSDSTDTSAYGNPDMYDRCLHFYDPC